MTAMNNGMRTVSDLISWIKNALVKLGVNPQKWSFSTGVTEVKGSLHFREKLFFEVTLFEVRF